MVISCLTLLKIDENQANIVVLTIQTRKVESKENVCSMMLYFAKEYAAYPPLPWERKGRNLFTPVLVQREYSRIIKDFEQHNLEKNLNLDD